MKIRAVTFAEAPALQRLMLSNADYTRRVEGGAVRTDAAQEVLSALPPGAEPSQKWSIGVWDEDVLLACADVIVGWPDPSTAHIGLLMTDGSLQGQGLGRGLHEAVIEMLIETRTIDALRLSIVDSNATAADAFWRKMGYAPTGEAKPYSSGSVSSIARIWTRALVVA